MSGEERDPSRAVTTVFEIAKADVDTQFRIAERFDTKARAFFTIAAALFTAAQAVALRPDVLSALDQHNRSTVLAWAIVAGCVLTVALLATALATMLKKDVVVDPDELRRMFNAADQPWKTEELVSYYMDLMERRQNANEGRRQRLYAAQLLCGASIMASAVELLVALHAFA